jgi:septal ring factor EnvC (AmiA/AmiB activator)
VQAGDGLIYVYGGAGELAVSIGDSLRKGSLVGKAEADGDGKATVYFFVFRGADSLDPRSIPRD